MNSMTLAESENYLLTYEYEYPILINKITNRKIDLRNQYGDPTCGIIDINEKWCIVGVTSRFTDPFVFGDSVKITV
jgi:hypothetical protein